MKVFQCMTVKQCSCNYLSVVLRVRSSLTSKMVKPGLFCSVVLNTIEMFFSVVHVVLKRPVTVVAVVPLPHGSGVVSFRQRSFKTSERQQLHNITALHDIKCYTQAITLFPNQSP